MLRWVGVHGGSDNWIGIRCINQSFDQSIERSINQSRPRYVIEVIVNIAKYAPQCITPRHSPRLCPHDDHLLFLCPKHAAYAAFVKLSKGV